MFIERYKGCICSILLTMSVPLVAEEIGNDDIQFSGFATVGIAMADSDLLGYRKNISSDKGVFSGDIDFLQHSLVGLQADWSIASNIDFVYQGVVRYLPKPSFDRITTLAFMRYELNTNWIFRLGRTAPELFLLTEYRDIDFSYTWATVPNEVYGIIPNKSIDGLDVTFSDRVFGGIFKGKLFAGLSAAEVSTAGYIQESQINNLFGISITFDHFDWVINAKHSQASIANEADANVLLAATISEVPDSLWPNSEAFAQSLLLKGENVNYSSVSGQYRWNDWLATTEFSQIDANSDVIPTITSGYGALSYRFNAHQLYSMYAFTHANNYVFDEPGVDEETLAALVYATTQLMNFYAANQTTISLGWRWDVTNTIASSLQWNYTDVAAGGATLWLKTPQYQDTAETINTLLYSISMVF